MAHQKMDDTTDELFFKKLRDTSKSNALVILSDLILLDVNWNTTQLVQPGPEDS